MWLVAKQSFYQIIWKQHWGVLYHWPSVLRKSDTLADLPRELEITLFFCGTVHAYCDSGTQLLLGCVGGVEAYHVPKQQNFVIRVGIGSREDERRQLPHRSGCQTDCI
jgi:hypothetical protein